MNDFTVQIFCHSSEYQKAYKKRTWILIVFWIFGIFIFYSCFLIQLIVGSSQIHFDSQWLNSIFVVSPLITQKEYIEFALAMIVSAIPVGIGIFWARSKKFNFLNTKIIQITSEEITQEFNQKISQQILWNQVKKVNIFSKVNGQSLYIEICGVDNQRFRIYGVEPWLDLINIIQKICDYKNIKLEKQNTKIGSEGYLIGEINIASILIMPIATLYILLNDLGFKLYANIVIFISILLNFIDIAFLSKPLETDRSKYIRSAIFSFLLYLFIIAFLWWREK
jgi:hypothetical protein